MRNITFFKKIKNINIRSMINTSRFYTSDIDTIFINKILDFVSPIKCKYNKQPLIERTIINNLVKTLVIEDSNKYEYCINEPDITRDSLHELVLNILNNSSSYIKNNIDEETNIIKYYEKKINSKVGPLFPILNDELVEEIALNAPGEPVKVYLSEPVSMWVDSNVILDSENANRVARNLAQLSKKPLSIAFPIAEGMLPDGHRVAITWGKEVSRRGTSFVVRLKRMMPPSLPQLIRQGTLSSLAASYLWYILELKGSILIIGGMASGKSLIGSELVLVKLNKTTRLLTFEQLWNEAVRASLKVRRFADIEYIDASNMDLQVLTLSKAKVKWAKPKYLIRHKVREKIYKIKTESGREIHVTKDHSILVLNVEYDREKPKLVLRVARPTELKTGKHFLPSIRELTLDESITELDPTLVSTDIGYLLGFLTPKHICEKQKFLVNESAVLEKVLGILKKHGILQYTTNCNQRGNCVAIVKIDNTNLNRILGSKIAKESCEGKIPDIFWNMSKNWRCSFLAGLIDSIATVDASKHNIEINITNKGLAYGLLYAFASIGIYTRIREKRENGDSGRISYLLSISMKANKEKLSGIMEYLSKSKIMFLEKGIQNQYNAKNNSLVLDEIPNNSARDPEKCISKNNHILEPNIHEDKGGKLSSTAIRDMVPVDKKIYKVTPKGIGFDKVVLVEEMEYNGYVYDIEVPETENFEANGIFVHNTTLLQSLINALPPWSRVVTIEDTPELQIFHENWDGLSTRIVYSKNSEAPEIDLYELSKFALRRRADYLIIGEIRGREAQVMAQAVATGHGSMTTFHAYDEKAAFFRLTSEPISLDKDFIANIWAIITLRAENSGKRRVVRIQEIGVDEENKIRIEPVIEWAPKKGSFEPELAKDLVDKSIRLKTVSKTLGLSKENIIDEIATREEFLANLSNKNIDTITFRKYLNNFYIYKNKVI